MRTVKVINTIIGAFTEERFIRFRKAYAKAVVEEQESFFFEEVKCETVFAKYIVEFLTDGFKSSPVSGNSRNSYEP